MSKAKEWEVESVNISRLLSSLNHRLLSLRKIRKPLRTYDRTARTLQMIRMVWNCPDDSFLVMNCDMNSLWGPDDFDKSKKRRDRLWKFLLGAKEGSDSGVG